VNILFVVCFLKFKGEAAYFPSCYPILERSAPVLKALGFES